MKTKISAKQTALSQKQNLWTQIFSKKMLICLFTGFSSGLPAFVIIQMLPVWLSDNQISVKTIGALTLVTLPYTLKFLWAPLLDRYFPHFLGRRRSWMAISQLALLTLIYALGQLSPQTQISMVILLTTLICFASATQDIVLDAYRREILCDEELGLGNTIHINAYRLGGLIPGGLSIYLSTLFTWQTVFLITALFMLAGLFLTLFLSEEPDVPHIPKNEPFYQTFLRPLKEFFTRKGVVSAVGFIIFLFLYKFGDSLATALQSKFILDMGFSKENIAAVVKVTSLWSSIVAGTLGGIAMLRLGVNRALWVFGFVQLITIGGFIWLASYGRFDVATGADLLKLGLVICAEYVGVGLGTVAFVAFMAKETNPLYTATQLALFTSLAALPSKGLSALSGVMVDAVGYYYFFWLCFVLAIPGMLCLFWVAPWHESNN